MNVLFLADANSIHDKKWITYFVQRRLIKAFILPRRHHQSLHSSRSILPVDVVELKAISDFSVRHFYRTLYTAYCIRQIIRKNNIDLIHVLYAEPNALWCVFRYYFSVPMIITCRGTDVLKTIPQAFKGKSLIDFLVSRAYRRAFRKADWVTATSSSQLVSVSAFSGRHPRMSVIRTGVDITLVNADTSSFFPAVEVPYFLFPRYIRPFYNHEFCLDAIAILPPEVRKKYKMVFVGKDSGDARYQQVLIDRMNSIPDVTFVFLPAQPQQAIMELYKRAALVIMTPLSDGSPVSAMEAIACGAKVILGPLEYDPEIFAAHAFRLTGWRVQELADLMQNVVETSASDKAYTTNFQSLVDREREMDKVWQLYQKSLK